MNYTKVCRGEICCNIPDGFKLPLLSREFLVKSKKRSVHKEALIEKLPRDGGETYATTMLSYHGDSDYLGKKQTLYRQGIFKGTWQGRELITVDFFHATQKTFYKWHLFLRINDDIYAIVIRGEGLIENDEPIWIEMINSIAIHTQCKP